MRSDCTNHFGLEEQSQEKNIERQVNRYFRGGNKQSEKCTRKGCIQVATHLTDSKRS